MSRLPAQPAVVACFPPLPAAAMTLADIVPAMATEATDPLFRSCQPVASGP